MGKSHRRIARELALEMLYQFETGIKDINELLNAEWLDIKTAKKLGWLKNNKASYEKDIASKQGEIRTFAESIVIGTIEHLQELDSLISKNLIHWVIERIAIIDLSIMRAALYEILYMEDIHSAVTLNEAIEIAKEYGNEKSCKFINGVLDAIRKKDKEK